MGQLQNRRGCGHVRGMGCVRVGATSRSCMGGQKELLPCIFHRAWGIRLAEAQRSTTLSYRYCHPMFVVCLATKEACLALLCFGHLGLKDPSCKRYSCIQVGDVSYLLMDGRVGQGRIPFASIFPSAEFTTFSMPLREMCKEYSIIFDLNVCQRRFIMRWRGPREMCQV